MQNIKSLLPDYAKDIKLNISKVLTVENDGLNEQQLFGIALASVYATRNHGVIVLMEEAVREILSSEHIQAAKTAATLMAMNNIYYRFVHLVSDKEYQSMPAQLRMQAIANPGIDKLDFELYSLAISAINGCGMCMDSHEKTAIKSGLNKLAIQHTIRIAAVMNATAQALQEINVVETEAA